MSASSRTPASRAARGPRGGRVPRLARALGLLARERRLVDEHVGSRGRRDQHVARARVAREHDLRPARSGPITCSGRDAADGLAALQAAEVRAGRDAELLGELGVEAARPSSSTSA